MYTCILFVDLTMMDQDPACRMPSSDQSVRPILFVKSITSILILAQTSTT